MELCSLSEMQTHLWACCLGLGFIHGCLPSPVHPEVTLSMAGHSDQPLPIILTQPCRQTNQNSPSDLL